MTLRGIPQGGVPIGMQNALNGTVSVVSLVTLAAGTTQNVQTLPSDFVIIATTNAGNTALTIPDPNKYGGVPGDMWLVAVGQVTNSVLIFPPTGGAIDAAGANASVTCAAGTTSTFILQSFTATSSVWIADGGS